MEKELEKNISIIKDMLGDNYTLSEIANMYNTISDCVVSKEIFLGFIMSKIDRR